MGSFLSTTKKRNKSNDQEITDVDRAILSLKTQRRKLNSDRRRLEDVLQQNVIAIKELIKTDKGRALLALKKKKMREEQIQNLDKWLMNVEQLLGNIELAQQQNAILAALKSGTDAMKNIQKEVKLEDVDKWTEDTAEAKAYLDEIQEALAADSREEVEQLEEELQALEKDLFQEEISQLPTTPETPLDLPSVPSGVAKEPVEEPSTREEPLAA